MVPRNLLPAGRTADYIITGVWSQKAIKEAKAIGQVHSAFDGAARGVPPDSVRLGDQLLRRSGVRAPHHQQHDLWHAVALGAAGSRRARHSSPTPRATCSAARSTCRSTALIYAGAQKNLGPSGVVLVIIRDDLLDRAPTSVPPILQYKTHAKEKSLYNTPNTFGVYLMGEVFKWIKAGGGLDAMARRNAREGEAALRHHRQQRLLARYRRRRQPLAHERLLPGGDRGAGGQVLQGSHGGRPRRAQGPSRRRAACARASTMRARCRRSRRWLDS